MRRNEILGLSRASVDWQNGFANLDKTKNGTSRAVPLNNVALEALKSLPTRIDGQLFPLTPAQVSVAFHREVRSAGIETFRLHDCRHCFASYQAMAGVQGRGLQSLLGHKDPRMTSRYAHLSDSYLSDAVDRVQLGAKRPTKADEKIA